VGAQQSSSVGMDESDAFVDGLDHPLHFVTTAHEGERTEDGSDLEPGHLA